MLTYWSMMMVNYQTARTRRHEHDGHARDAQVNQEHTIPHEDCPLVVAHVPGATMLKADAQAALSTDAHSLTACFLIHVNRSHRALLVSALARSCMSPRCVIIGHDH